MNKQQTLEKAYKNGFEGERNVRGCAQCAIAAVQDATEIRNDLVYKSASGLAGGAGECTDGLCGGYSGGIIAMSMFFGRTRAEEATEKGRADKYVSFRMAAALHDKFMEKYGTVICSQIHKKIFGRSFDLRDDEQKQAFRDAGAHEREDGCCDVVGDGARWATELILDEIEANGLSLEDFKDLIHTEK
ncbi:MAG: C_GCAxxG_C_C family protein [Spirochaetales bacterium]|nr:C_GCAxxG_C_C family protein [Spirochaetales bacterium]